MNNVKDIDGAIKLYVAGFLTSMIERPKDVKFSSNIFLNYIGIKQNLDTTLSYIAGVLTGQVIGLIRRTYQILPTQREQALVRELFKKRINELRKALINVGLE